MKRIISFSLWGTNEKYTEGAVENAKLAKILFPGWICRFYIDRSTVTELPIVFNTLSKMSNTEIVIKDSTDDWSGLFWRFLPCSDVDVEYMLSRDCDSRLSKREKSAVDEWLKSGKSFHIIRDHPWHTLDIMGGLWGAKTEGLREMEELIATYVNYKKEYDDDQKFLSQYIYPIIKSDCLIHDEFAGMKKIPMRRKRYEFVGQVFDPENERTKEHRIALEQELEKKRMFLIIRKNIRNYTRKIYNLWFR